MGDAERRELLDTITAGLSSYDEGELLRLTRSMSEIEKERSYVFEELRIPVGSEPRVDLDELDDNDVMYLDDVDDLDAWYRSNYGGGEG